MLNRLFWMFTIFALLASVGLIGGAIYTGMHQHPGVHQASQESFTVPMYDKSDSEVAVYGPDSVIEEA